MNAILSDAKRRTYWSGGHSSGAGTTSPRRYYLVSPRWLAWLRGELVEDSWAHVQLLFFAGISLAVVLGEYAALRKSAPGLARRRSRLAW